MTGVDAWGNGPAHSTRTVVVDTAGAGPDATSPRPPTRRPGSRRTAMGSATPISLDRHRIPRTGALEARVARRQLRRHRQTWTVPNGSAATTVTWDGRNDRTAHRARRRVHDHGRSTRRRRQHRRPVDRHGQPSSARCGRSRARGRSSSRRTWTRWRPSTKLSFVLARPMTVTWRLGTPPAPSSSTRYAAASLPAGSYGWWFDGRADRWHDAAAWPIHGRHHRDRRHAHRDRSVAFDPRRVHHQAERHDARAAGRRSRCR